jgi:hypothetical protein
MLLHEDPICRFQTLALFGTVMQSRENKSKNQPDVLKFIQPARENGGSVDHLQKALLEYTKSKDLQEVSLRAI